MLDRARMVAVVRVALIKELGANFGVIKSGEAASRIVEAIEVDEILEFEKRHEMALETIETPFDAA